MTQSATEALVVEVKHAGIPVDFPWILRLHGISEEAFETLTDEDTKAELLDGEMVVHSPASLRHEDVASFLGGLMRFYAETRGLGRVIASGNGVVRLAADRTFAPDIFFIRQERVPSPLPRAFEGAPDLVVEVLSSSTRSFDLGDKRPIYREAGVGEVWFVDLERRQMLIDRRQEPGYREEVVTEGRAGSTVLDGFWVNPAWLWTDPPPNGMTCL
jgi:Uma2 family endonuclease